MFKNIAEKIIVACGLHDQIQVVEAIDRQFIVVGVFVAPTDKMSAHLEGLDLSKKYVMAYHPDTLIGLTKNQMAAIAAHECAHVQNGDLESPEYLDHVASGASTPFDNPAAELAADQFAAQLIDAKSMKSALVAVLGNIVTEILIDRPELNRGFRGFIEDAVERNIQYRYKALDQVIERHFGA